MKRSLTVIACFLMMGCSYLKEEQPRLILPPSPPANMMTPAPEIPDLPDNANMGDLANGYVDLMESYRELKMRHQALVLYITSFFHKHGVE